LSNPQIEVRTHGRVRAAKKVILSARIGGEVIWIGPKMNEGSFFKKGDPLLSIGIRQSQSRLKAPFNGVVQSKDVDLGQYVNPGTQLAVLLGSDQAEVVIDLPMGRMDWLPQSSTSLDGENQFPATVSLAGMISASVWNATVKRHLLELTPRGMMVQLIAEAEDPFRLKRKSQVKSKNKRTSEKTLINTVETANSESPPTPQTSNMPLFVGAFVNVSIPGRRLENVVNIPAQALRDQDTVWVALEGELEVRRVKIAHLDQDNIYLSGGVKPGEQIIISPIKGAANGLKIRIAGKENIRKKGDRRREQLSGERKRRRKRGDGKGEQGDGKWEQRGNNQRKHNSESNKDES